MRNSKRPDYGKLWYDGKPMMINKKFFILQAEKKRLIAMGYYKKELFKITY